MNYQLRDTNDEFLLLSQAPFQQNIDHSTSPNKNPTNRVNEVYKVKKRLDLIDFIDFIDLID
jgi:hypothetical protein